MDENFLKTTNALYKMLDFLPDNDPLKNKAKEKALAILENKALVHQAQGWVLIKELLLPESQKASFQLLHDIEMLLAYLRIGQKQGWIDSVNFLIISKEYQKIKDSISVLPGVAKGGYGTIKPLDLDQKPENSRITTTDLSLQAPIHGAREPEHPQAMDVFSRKALARQKKIMEILGRKSKAQVSDFIKEIPNVTKRTLRRDLDDLLRQGMVKRAGDWNKIFYQLSQSI